MSTDNDWITTPITWDLLRGALDAERTEHGLLPHRLPARARAQNTDGQLAMAESQPSGVRLALRTRATALELDTLPTKRVYAGAPPRPDGVYDLLVDGRPAGRGSVDGGNTVTLDMTTGTTAFEPGPVGTLRFTGLPEGSKTIEIWLPHNETTELVALRTDAPVDPAPDPGRRVWLHHGSSISQGSDAASPTTTWPALAASLGGVELVNLGLAGSALLDPFTARAMRDTPADLISVKIGINVVNHDAMRLRAFAPTVSPPGLALSRAVIARDMSMPCTGTPRPARGSAIRPMPTPNSSARPPPASRARRSTAGSTASGVNMPADDSSYRAATLSPK